MRKRKQPMKQVSLTTSKKSSAYTAALMKYNSFDHSREDPEAGAARKKAMEDAKVAMDTAKRLPWIQLATR